MTAFAPRLRDFPTENGKTLADAEKACNDAFSVHSTIQQCISQAGMNFDSEIECCVEDFKVTIEKYMTFNYPWQ